MKNSEIHHFVFSKTKKGATVKEGEYRGYHEMTQKACERSFCHVIAFVELFEMPHFQNQLEKMGNLNKLTRDQFQNRKGTKNNILRFSGISKNCANAIT